MTTIKRFEDIDAWKISRELTVLVYRITNEGQFARDYGLRDQIRRAAVSVMSNIAEGYESRTKALFIDYLGRAKGSAGEVRSQAYVALDAGYISNEQFDNLMDLSTRCSGKIVRFMDYLEMDLRKKRG
jgi:four helix bundle protein